MSWSYTLALQRHQLPLYTTYPPKIMMRTLTTCWVYEIPSLTLAVLLAIVRGTPLRPAISLSAIFSPATSWNNTQRHAPRSNVSIRSFSVPANAHDVINREDAIREDVHRKNETREDFIQINDACLLERINRKDAITRHLVLNWHAGANNK